MSRSSWALVAAIAGSSMSFIDGSAVNVALPILQRDLHASSAAVQWVVEGYGLFLCALILIGGSLGDAYGRRRTYAIGIAIFTLASVACAFAQSVEVLVAARCLQGIGGALATPGSLALISAAYSGEARGRAIGTWSGFSAIMAAAGPVLGGWLVQLGSWRWVFVINVPLGAIVLAILALRGDESRDPAASRALDVTGATLATGGLGTLVFGLIRLQGGTVDPAGLGSALGGAALLVAFVIAELRARHPMVRLDLFRSPAFAGANAYTFLLYAALGGSLYLIPFDLINVQGYPPGAAGAALLPFIAIMFAFSRFSGGLVARVGARGPLALGGAFAAVAFVVFGFAGVGHPYWTTFFPGALVLGLGGACFVAPLTTTVMDAVDASHAGLASGINNAISRTAGLVAIAALGIVLANAFEASLARSVPLARVSAATRAAIVRDRASIVAGQVPAEIASPSERAVVGTAIRTAYAGGFRTAMVVSALLALLASGIALIPGVFVRPFRPASSSR